MPRLFTKAVMRTRCIQRASMVGDDSIEAPEWDSLMSEVYGEAYEEVADADGRYFETSTSITTTDAGYIAEPVNQLSLVDNLELVLDVTTGKCRRLYPIQPQERALVSGLSGDPRRFELVDDRFYLYPKPPSGKVMQLRYIPQAPDLTSIADADLIDVTCTAGEAFLIWGVAAIARSKDDRFVDYAENQKEKARERLKGWAGNRARQQSPRRIVEDDRGVLVDWRTECDE